MGFQWEYDFWKNVFYYLKIFIQIGGVVVAIAWIHAMIWFFWSIIWKQPWRRKEDYYEWVRRAKYREDMLQKDDNFEGWKYQIAEDREWKKQSLKGKA